MALLDVVSDDVGRVFVSDWAESVTYTPAGESSRLVSIIFDREAEVSDIGEMIRMDGVAAFGHVETATVPELAIGDAMIARGVTYRVVGVEPDGTGVTRFVLGI